MNPRIVVKARRPRWFRWTVLGAGAFAAIIVGWLLVSLLSARIAERYEVATYDRDRLLELRRDLARQLRDEKAKSEALRQQVVYLEQSQQIDRAAFQQVRDSLKSLQAQVVSLQEQVVFYRSIVSPEETRAGVRVYDFRVLPAGEQRFNYELILIQSARQDTRIRGRAQVVVEGRTGDGDKTVVVTQSSDAGDLLFSFRYFQEFAGTFELPADFRPLRATVSIRADGRGSAIEDVYDWERILGV
jgi:hypothetical protein